MHLTNFFGRSLSQVTVCTSFSLLKPPPTVLTSFVRGNIHTCFPPFNICSLKTLILIVVYLNMCNSLTITYVFFILAYCRFHALCFIFRVFLSILLNCVKVFDCHTFHKRLLTYLLRTKHFTTHSFVNRVYNKYLFQSAYGCRETN